MTPYQADRPGAGSARRTWFMVAVCLLSNASEMREYPWDGRVDKIFMFFLHFSPDGNPKYPHMST